MNAFLDRALSLRRLSTGGQDVEIAFVHELPAWAWALIAVGAFAIAGLTYVSLVGSKAARWALLSLRGLLLILIVVLLCQPHLVRQIERVEKDLVVVLADRSASMTVADVEGGGTRATRESQLRRILDEARPTFQRLEETRGVLTMGFDGAAYELPPGDLGPPVGTRTALGQALEQVLGRVAARPLAGVVVLSDGRSSDAVTRATLRQFDARGVPVFVVPLGSPDPLVDLAVTRVEAPSAAFAQDIIPINVRLDRLGGGEGLTRGRVQLIGPGEAVLDEQPFEIGAGGGLVTLTVLPDGPGPQLWTARVLPENPDLSNDNNALPVRVEVIDRQVRVVYFDGYPRWEYRYLKNLLVREPSILSSALLLASDRRYIQEGTEPLATLPRTQAEWAPIDVVVMGDLRPGLFSEEQLRQVRDLVSQRGAGLLWIGGESSTPNAWRGTPLADLLPFILSGDPAESVAAHGGPVFLEPGPAADRFGVLRMSLGDNPGWPEELSTPSLGWPQIHYAQQIDPRTLKPTADVLALARPTSGDSPTPLIMTMRYGAGRVAYVGTDETWRYRYGRGEILPERLWIPLIRLLARESLGRTGKPAILEAAPDRVSEGQPVRITLRLLDQALLEQRPPSVRIMVRSDVPGVGSEERPTELTLRAEGTEEGSLPSLFATTWIAGRVGIYRVEPSETLLAGLDLSARVEVAAPDDELRLPQTDHPSLAALAQATGGQVLSAERLRELPDLLPNRELRILGNPEVETLWDKPLAWTLLIFLMATEWMGRRLIKLA